MSRCNSCTQEIEPGQEICPHCLASVSPAECRFTVENDLSFHSRRSITLSTPLLPDLDSIDFSPSSPFYKIFSFLRGGVISALIAVFFTGLGGAWWIQAHRSEGRELNRSAGQSFEKGQYAEASRAWLSAFDAYGNGFSGQGQVDALVGLSRCHVQAKDFTEALVVLQRAQKIEADESIKDMIKKCHRMAAVEHLKRAQVLFGPGSFGKAYLESELAVDGFERGEGTGAQKAGAYRMAARCSLELEDFEGAQIYLDKAFANEGKSKQNVALQADCDKAEDEYLGQAVADIGKDGYIPQGKLDPIAIQQAAAAASASNYPRRRRSTGTYLGSSANSYTGYRPATRRRLGTTTSRPRVYRPRTYQLPTRRVRTSLDTSPSYPTHNPRPSYSPQDYFGVDRASTRSTRPSRDSLYYSRAVPSSKTRLPYSNRSNHQGY